MTTSKPGIFSCRINTATLAKLLIATTILFLAIWLTIPRTHHGEAASWDDVNSIIMNEFGTRNPRFADWATRHPFKVFSGNVQFYTQRGLLEDYVQIIGITPHSCWRATPGGRVWDLEQKTSPVSFAECDACTSCAEIFANRTQHKKAIVNSGERYWSARMGTSGIEWRVVANCETAVAMLEVRTIEPIDGSNRLP